MMVRYTALVIISLDSFLGNNETYNTPQKIESLNNVEFIACGGYHVVYNTFSDEIYCWK